MVGFRVVLSWSCSSNAQYSRFKHTYSCLPTSKQVAHKRAHKHTLPHTHKQTHLVTHTRAHAYTHTHTYALKQVLVCAAKKHYKKWMEGMRGHFGQKSRAWQFHSRGDGREGCKLFWKRPYDDLTLQHVKTNVHTNLIQRTFYNSMWRISSTKTQNSSTTNIPFSMTPQIHIIKQIEQSINSLLEHVLRVSMKVWGIAIGSTGCRTKMTITSSSWATKDKKRCKVADTDEFDIQHVFVCWWFGFQYLYFTPSTLAQKATFLILKTARLYTRRPLNCFQWVTQYCLLGLSRRQNKLGI